MSPRPSSSVLLRILAYTAPSVVSASCLGPLPPENPRTQLERPAEVVPIEVVATAEGALAPVSDLESSSPEPSKPQRSSPGQTRVLYRDIGLRAPDSVLHDPTRDVYLVANTRGASPASQAPGPAAKPTLDNGFISRLRPDGSVDRLKFIEGGNGGVELSAPRGLWILGDTLFIADVDHVRSFDANSGAHQRSWEIPGAVSLQKVTTDATGNIYVSDSGGSADSKDPRSGDAAGLYRIGASGNVSVIAKGAALSGPSGIAIDAKGLLVVSLAGSNLTRYDSTGNSLDATPLPSNGASGLVATGDGQWLVSSQQANAIYRGDFALGFDPVVTDVAAPGDIGFDVRRQRVLIPVPRIDEVWAVPLPAAHKEGATARASRR